MNESGYICSSFREPSGTYNIGKQHRYALRFNLSPGDLKFKWMLIDKGEIHNGYILVHFYDPEVVSFNINNGFLKNNRSGAEKINDTGNKFVVSMVLSSDINVSSKMEEGDIKVNYNPSILPYWWLSKKDSSGEVLPIETDESGQPINVDKKTFNMYTSGSGIFLK